MITDMSFYSPIVWIALLLIICGIVVTIFSKIARKAERPIIFVVGMFITCGVVACAGAMKRQFDNQRNKLLNDYQLYSNILSIIPDNEDYTINNDLYVNRLLAGNVYYDADNPKPRYAYYGESGFGSLTKNWSNQELQAKVESLIDHFNRLAAESDCREQFLFDAPKNVIEDMAHAAYVLNSDIYA